MKCKWREEDVFLVVPPPQPDELLSSWLTRMAFVHGYSLTTFISLFISSNGSALSRTDIDFREDTELFETLSQKSSLPYERIFQMSLRSEEACLFESEHGLYPPKQIRKLKDKRTHYGLMYCPKCLAEDGHPYWRKQWRYLFYNACPTHQIYLTDRCWKCYERVRFYKMKPSNALIYCSKCGRDYRKSVTNKVPLDHHFGLDTIQWFEFGLKQGFFIIGSDKIKSLFVFEVYTILAWLLDRGDTLKLANFPMLDSYKKICFKNEHYHSRKHRSIQKNFYLTAMVYHLFQDYPNNFIDFSITNNLTHRDFVHGFNHMPFWFKERVDEIIPAQNKLGREISENEIRGAIKYLKNLGDKVTQESVAKVVGCHPTIHKGFVRIYKKIQLCHN